MLWPACSCQSAYFVAVICRLEGRLRHRLGACDVPVPDECCAGICRNTTCRGTSDWRRRTMAVGEIVEVWREASSATMMLLDNAQVETWKHARIQGGWQVTSQQVISRLASSTPAAQLPILRIFSELRRFRGHTNTVTQKLTFQRNGNCDLNAPSLMPCMIDHDPAKTPVPKHISTCNKKLCIAVALCIFIAAKILHPLPSSR